MNRKFTGQQIRQTFIDFFVEKHAHTFVASSSLVPGEDQTLLFTNAGMVQFKDVFIGTDARPYSRAVNSQKCMRVAGKHNDLDDVGRDDTHHTFFEMLGNWSFGDYYKKEAITWAWELLTEVWELPKDNIYATCFEDEQGVIPQDTEAAEYWLSQPGFNPSQVLFFGRKDNFWEMAETGPCGPCSEIHLDRGPAYCDKSNEPGHECRVNGDCARFLELWNLVFIQYNRTSATHLEPLPATHVDTGMGFERIVSVLQNTPSNYRTDLLFPLIKATQELTGQTDDEREENFTPYRVIADHARAAAFLIADGVVPGNTSRNYICRMIIRRAARFGSQIGLIDPFLAVIAEKVIGLYGGFYPELSRNKATILDNLTREEVRFQRTVEGGVAKLEQLIQKAKAKGQSSLPGEETFDLYATYGLPLEISRDIAREQGFTVDEAGFLDAMESHRVSSGSGEIFGKMDGEDVGVYRAILASLHSQKQLSGDGVLYDPYGSLTFESQILALIRDGKSVLKASPGEHVEVLLPATSFYIEAGGQVSDTGMIRSVGERQWEIDVLDMRRPAAGVIVHVGKVISGEPMVEDRVEAVIDVTRRHDIMRNHTATHLLHAELHAVLGDHARQAGSLVAPDRLRFDFTHPEALTKDQIAQIEKGVNQSILGNYALNIVQKPLQQAINEGAIALFGEKYAETVRTITIGNPETFSYELCGGTHVEETGDIGIFLITSEGSVASGIRRIEAVTGREAYNLVRQRTELLRESALLLGSSDAEVPVKINGLMDELRTARRQLEDLRREISQVEFRQQLNKIEMVGDVAVLAIQVPGGDRDSLRQLSDQFRSQHTSGVAVLASVQNDQPVIVAAITDNLIQHGLHAGELVKFVATPLGGGGGGRPTLAQAGGKDASKLPEVLASVPDWVRSKLDQRLG